VFANRVRQVFRHSRSIAGNAEGAKGFAWPIAEASVRRRGRGENAICSATDKNQTSARSSARHGKAADSEQVLMKDDHCSGREVFGDLIKVGENDRCLLRGSASDQAADEAHRRIAGP
jgi:hypothetical protein